jgi:hypothetical protein
MITYLKYLELLDEKNIVLYDFQKRISYFRLNNFKNIQSGGGNENNIIKINNLETYQLEKVIFDLLENKTDMIKYYLK